MSSYFKNKWTNVWVVILKTNELTNKTKRLQLMYYKLSSIFTADTMGLLKYIDKITYGNVWLRLYSHNIRLQLLKSGIQSKTTKNT